MRARALADKALLDIFVDAAAGMEQAQQALVIAREVDEPALLSRALTACGLIAVAVARADAAASYFAEAIDLARAVDDRWRLAQILTFQAVDAVVAGDPVAARPAAQEARELAAAIGDHSNALWCRWCLGYAQLMQGSWPRPPPNSARWWTRPRRLRKCCTRPTACRAWPSRSPTRVN